MLDKTGDLVKLQQPFARSIIGSFVLYAVLGELTTYSIRESFRGRKFSDLHGQPKTVEVILMASISQNSLHTGSEVELIN